MTSSLSSEPERTACRTMGDSNPLNPVTTAVSCLATHPVSCYQRRSGPAVEFGGGVSQALCSGKYAYIRNNHLPDQFLISSISDSLLTIDESLALPSYIECVKSSNVITAGVTCSPGRDTTGIMGTPEPPATVARMLPAINSRPGPVCGSGDGGFQTTTNGKYDHVKNIPPPSSSVASSTHGSSSACPDLVATGSFGPLSTPTDRLLSVYYQNVRGLRTKIVQLRLLLSSCDYDLLVLTETWLRSDIEDAEITADYTLFRCDRSHLTSSFSRGGGVLIAVKKGITCESVLLPDCDNLEQVAVRLKATHRSIYIVAIYLPPNSRSDLYSAHAHAVQWLADRSSDSDVILSLGDFNLPDLRWQFDLDVSGYIPLNASSESEQSLIENMFAAGFQQICGFVNTNGRLLDLAFVSPSDRLDITTPSTPLLSVDHHHAPFILLVDSSMDDLSAPDDENRRFNFNVCDFEHLNSVLTSTDWETLLMNGSVDDLLSMFYEKLYEVLTVHVPLKRRVNASVSSKPWWTPELRHLRNTLRKARSRFFRTRSENERSILHEVETSYQSLLTSSYESYIARVQCNVKQNPSLFWSFIKNQKSTSGFPSNVNYDGLQSTSNADAANLFATFFESVFTRVSPVPRRDCFAHIPSYDIALPVVQFSSIDVLKALNELDTGKVSSPDGIPPLLLKKCSRSLATPIARIFNHSLQNMVFPAAWKRACIIPIHKTGNRTLVTNYRGISILCCLSKVFEKLVHNIVYNVVSPIISESQHGFMKHRSTTTNLMCYVSALSREIELRRQVDSVYIDFEKAFDTVPHLLVITKLKHMGFPAWFTEWLWSYLSDRSAHVMVNSARSRNFNITSGVPQGSVLGPLIFIVFVNDLSSLLSSVKLSFADDLKIYRIIATVLDHATLQEDINTILVWCSDNGMRINGKKCKVISFSRRNNPTVHEYYMHNDLLDRVTSICDLGVTLDTKLRFDVHVGITAAKAFSSLGFIRRHAANFTDIHALKTLYCSLVRSVLEYAAPVWCPYYTTHILTIERIQRKFVRFALRQLPWNDPTNLPPYTERCRLIDLETLSSRRTKLQRVFVFDVLSVNIDCPALLEQVPFNVPPRRFRNSSLLAVPAHRTNYGYHNPFDSCLRAFNNVNDKFDFNLSKKAFCNRIRDIA